jgi:hypothetical protein
MTRLELNSQSWFRQRNYLNHDWLQNILFLQVSALRGHCLGEMSSLRCVHESISEAIREWRAHKDQVAVLIKTCDARATPASAFHYPPLSRCEADVLEWLPNLIHRRWLTKYEILDRMLVAEQLFQKADRSAEELDVINQTIDCDGPILVGTIDSFLSALMELSQAISRLPNRILFV